MLIFFFFFFFSSRRRHTRFKCDWSSDVCSSDLHAVPVAQPGAGHLSSSGRRQGEQTGRGCQQGAGRPGPRLFNVRRAPYACGPDTRAAPGRPEQASPMDLATFLIQCLNALQYGLLLFLVASGLTLIFGIMGVINLAHGSFYMIGAYMA